MPCCTWCWRCAAGPTCFNTNTRGRRARRLTRVDTSCSARPGRTLSCDRPRPTHAARVTASITSSLLPPTHTHTHLCSPRRRRCRPCATVRRWLRVPQCYTAMHSPTPSAPAVRPSQPCAAVDDNTQSTSVMSTSSRPSLSPPAPPLLLSYFSLLTSCSGTFVKSLYVHNNKN